MKIKLSQFTAYRLDQTALYEWCGKAAVSKKAIEVIGDLMSKDPGPTEWRTFGFICPFTDGFPVHDLDGTARLMAVQFNERILPGSVRDEELLKAVARIRETEDRDLNKKEYAEIKEDVEFQLLPKAFIRRSVVPILVYKDRIMICATSAKKIEDVILCMSRLVLARKIDFVWGVYETKQSLNFFMTDLVKNGTSDGGDCEPGDIYFSAADAAKFKGSGEDKRTITIKDRDLQFGEIQDLLKQPGYKVTEMKIQMLSVGSDIDLAVDFALTDRFVVKAIKLSDATLNEHAEATDAHSTAWIAARYNLTIHDQLLRLLNQELPPEEEEL